MKFIVVILLLVSILTSSSSKITLKRLSLPSLSLSLSLLLCQPCYAETPLPGTCITESNPSVTTQFCRQLGLVEGRLRSCQANENCFSTSSKSASKYLTPWQYEFSSISAESSQSTLEDKVWDTLKASVKENGLKILQDKNDNGQRYLLAAELGSDVGKQPQGSSLFYEFTLKPTDKLILYRSVVDKTIFVYPLQQPVSDFGALQSKLEAIRNTANFLQVGSSSENDDALLFSQ